MIPSSFHGPLLDNMLVRDKSQLYVGRLWLSKAQSLINVTNGHTVNPPLTAHNYPSSLTLFYSWTKNSDPASTIQIQASSGLSARPSANPARNMTYTSTWKMPNCRLFYRYPPDQYTFSFIAQPVYRSTHSTTTSPDVQPIQITVSMKNNIAAFPKC